MSQNKRNMIGLLLIIIIAAVMLGVESVRRRQQAAAAQSQMTPGMPTAAPGSIPIYANGTLAGRFVPADLEQLARASFKDAEEGKTQEGWMLRDVLQLYVDTAALAKETAVVVSSSHRDKSARLTWAEVDDEANKVLFDLSGRGTLKLVSLLPRLDTRDEWVQDVDLIEIEQAP